MTPRTRRRIAATLVVGAFSTSCPGFAQADAPPGYPEDVIQWGVQRGETCEDIAKAAYGDARRVALLLRYNRISCTRGAPLKAGLTLVLPAKVTDVPSARIRSIAPSVRAKPAGGGWSDAAPGQPLATQSSVETLDDARADIQFIDRTRVFMAENTLVVIYGTAAQTAVSKATPPPAVELEAGEVRTALSALRGESVEVAAMGGRISSQSKDTVISKNGNHANVSVFEGRANVTSAGKSVSVPEKFGTRFEEKKAPEPPRPLPPAPLWTARPTVAVLGTKDGATVGAEWAAVPNARTYRVEVASDAAFEDLRLRAEVNADATRFRFEHLPVGEWFVRVRAIDKEDFLGLASETVHIRVATADVGAQGKIDGDVLTVSPYTPIPIVAPRGTELALDEGAFGTPPASLDLSRSRPKQLRFKGPDGVISVVRVNYAPPIVDLTTSRGSNPSDLEVRVAFRETPKIDVDERVRPKLRVTRRDGSSEDLALTRDGDVERATVHDSATLATLEVIDRAGVSLATMTPPPDAAVPAAVVERRLRALGVTAFPFAVGPGEARWWAPLPDDAGAVTGALDVAFDSGDPDVALRGLATAHVGPVGLEASFERDDSRAGASDGDVAWLGARARLVDLGDGAFELGPGMRIGVPTSGGQQTFQGEVGLSAGGRLGMLSLLGNVDFDLDGAPTAYVLVPIVAFGAALDPLEWLRTYAVLDGSSVRPSPGADALGIGGLTIGAEAGRYLFGGASVRVMPFESPSASLSATLTIGVREEPR